MEATIIQELTELTRMPVAGLKDRWRSLYGTEPPAYKRQYLIKRIAYRIQELALGGLSEKAKAKLEQLASQDSIGKTRKQKCQCKNGIVAGTRLIREWNGKQYLVTAVSGGFEYDGRRYRSLSAIAKAITGAHHSGPRFFGIQQHRVSA